MNPPLRLAFYGDDFTGSTDALESLARAQLARYPGLQAIGVAGLSRSLAPDAMDATLVPAFSALKALGARHVHYKVCSTFDSSPRVGSIGRAIELATGIFGGRFVPVVVGAPALGRYCAFGNLFARYGIGSAGEIHRLDRHPAMSRHPVTPADESDLRRHLGRQTLKQIGLVDVLQLERPATEINAAVDALVANGSEIIVFDALYPTHLGTIGAVIDGFAGGGHPFFTVGSSSIETALGTHWTTSGDLHPRHHWPDPGAAHPLLVVSGSCSPVTAGQIAWALDHGFTGVLLEPTGDARSATAAAVTAMQSGRSVVVFTDRGRVEGIPFPAHVLGDTLGRLAREAIAQTGTRRLVIAGGDTSSYAARALGLEAVEMIAPIAPGAPLCRVHAPGSPADGLEINFKGGQVGSEDYFGRVARPSFP